jgi:hypothetical protein
MKTLGSIGLLTLLVACSRSPSPEQSVKALKTIQSWTATAQMVGEAWQQGRVPQHYAQQTLAKTEQEIDREAKDLTAPPVIVKQMQQTISQMADRVDRSPSGAFAAALDRLSIQQRQLDRLTKTQEQNK